MVPAAGEYFDDTLAAASPDLLRTMIREFAQRMMDAEVEQLCGAGYGEISNERVNTRNGYRSRPWDTRAQVVVSHVQRHRCARCSVTATLTRGISHTWRRSNPVLPVRSSPAPHPPHRSGR
nr:transposase [Streptosporangium amethystogenes]